MAKQPNVDDIRLTLFMLVSKNVNTVLGATAPKLLQDCGKLTPSFARVSFQSAGLIEQDEAHHHSTVWTQSRIISHMHLHCTVSLSLAHNDKTTAHWQQDCHTVCFLLYIIS